MSKIDDVEKQDFATKLSCLQKGKSEFAYVVVHLYIIHLKLVISLLVIDIYSRCNYTCCSSISYNLQNCSKLMIKSDYNNATNETTNGQLGETNLQMHIPN